MTAGKISLYDRCVALWGKAAQAFQLAEECIELAHQAHKLARGRLHSTSELAEEMADVEIMIDEWKSLLKLGPDVEYWKRAKLERLEERVKKDEQRRVDDTKSPETALRG